MCLNTHIRLLQLITKYSAGNIVFYSIASFTYVVHSYESGSHEGWRVVSTGANVCRSVDRTVLVKQIYSHRYCYP